MVARGGAQERRSTVKKDNLQPQWDESFELVFDTIADVYATGAIHAIVLDWDAVGGDDKMCHGAIDVAALRRQYQRWKEQKERADAAKKIQSLARGRSVREHDKAGDLAEWCGTKHGVGAKDGVGQRMVWDHSVVWDKGRCGTREGVGQRMAWAKNGVGQRIK